MKKKSKWIISVLSLFVLAVIICLALVFIHFGGFNVGESVNVQELSKYTKEIEDISIKEGTRIVALGEATHGNSEFQSVKLEVFKLLVDKYGVRSFAIEGDFGGCEEVNTYIHGGEGTAQEAASKIGFEIYRTDEIVSLIEYMRQYNKTAPEGVDINFYGFDMQRYINSFNILVDACKEKNIDTKKLLTLIDNGEWNKNIDESEKVNIINDIKQQLKDKGTDSKPVQAANVLVQYLKIQAINDSNEAMDLRDRFMSENTEWILKEENKRKKGTIFVTGHNTHIAKYSSFNSMGKLLADKFGEGYYTIGTDFYKTKCNLPTSSGKRTQKVFYSHNPIAKAVKTLKLEKCFIDFDDIPEDTELAKQIREYSYMSNIGERYSPIMKLLPPSYRMFQPPAGLYDSMIIITYATPTTIH